MGIDPVTHKPFSHLMAEIATTLAPPQVAHLAEAALGSFKDEMLHLLTKKRIDFQLQHTVGYEVVPPPGNNLAAGAYISQEHEGKDNAIQNINLGMPRAMPETENLPSNNLWPMNRETSEAFTGICSAFPTTVGSFQYGATSYGNNRDDSPWSQSMCTGSTCTDGDQQGHSLLERGKNMDREETDNGKNARKGTTCVFNSDCVLWDLSDDLMDPIV